MKNKTIGLLFLFISISQLTWGQEIPFADSLLNWLQWNTKESPQEKIYLQTDKPYYAAREDIWFKVYLVNASTHLPQNLSTVVYVELLSPDKKVLQRRNIKIEKGSGSGDFSLPSGQENGTYYLRAHTNYLKNYGPDWFFQRPIQILNSVESANEEMVNDSSKEKNKSNKKSKKQIQSLDVQFFPEGGDLIADMNSKVALKSTSSDGSSIQIQGQVVDEKNEVVANFSTFKHGLGLFTFRPDEGRSYRAIINDEEYPFPKAFAEGYQLRIKNQKDTIEISIRASKQLRQSSVYLMGHIRGKAIFDHTASIGSKGLILQIPKQDLPNGIAHFTLFDGTGKPHAERLIFIDQKDNQPLPSIKLDKEIYQKRKKVRMEIQSLDPFGEAIASDCTISVTDAQQVAYSENDENILSYLLLNSDLKGRIENPGYYFAKEEASRKRLLDLLLMTQGWRRFTWKDRMNDPAMLEHAPETGFLLSGNISKFDQEDKKVASNVYISWFDERLQSREIQTNEDGRFLLGGLALSDTTDFLIQARIPKKGAKNKKVKTKNINALKGDKNTSIWLSDLSKAPFSDFQPIFPERGEMQSIKDFLDERYKIEVVEQNFDEKFVELDEVLVKARKAPKRDSLRRAYTPYGNPDKRVILDSLLGAETYGDFTSLLRRLLPAFTIQGNYPDQRVFIRQRVSSVNNLGALILVNGVETNYSLVQDINISTIEYIDIVRPGYALNLGDRAANGIIAIYLKEDAFALQNANFKKGRYEFIHPGYYQERAFYSPKYDFTNINNERPDFRTTLYWAPKVITDEEGKAYLEFFTCDNKSLYQIVLEGLTANGQPFRLVEKFLVGEE